MIAKITRTVIKRVVTLTWFNEETREVTDTKTDIFEDITETELVKRMKRSGVDHSEYGALISARISTNSEELTASMPLSEFVKYATLTPVTKKK
nr:MAG TPA: hypothetical protein [Caudoviricetes sp.]